MVRSSPSTPFAQVSAKPEPPDPHAALTGPVTAPVLVRCRAPMHGKQFFGQQRSRFESCLARCLRWAYQRITVYAHVSALMYRYAPLA